MHEVKKLLALALVQYIANICDYDWLKCPTKQFLFLSLLDIVHQPI